MTRARSPFRLSLLAGNPAVRMLRRVARSFVSRVRGVDAGGGGPRWGLKSSTRLPAAAMRAAAEPAYARAAHAFLNNSHAASAIEVFACSAVGEAGPRPQPQHPRQARALRIAFARWMASAGINGEHLADILTVMVKGMAVSGDAFAVMRVDDEDKLRLVVLDPEQVDRSLTIELGNGARIIEGIEYDDAGRVVAYWIFPDRPSAPFVQSFQSERVDASEVLHLYRPTLPGQARGLSILAPVLTKLREVDGVEDAMLARLRVSALFGGFVTDADGAADIPGESRGDGVLESDALEPGILKTLRPGQTIEFPNMPTVGDGPAFLKAQLHAIAAGVGLTYELLTGDLSGVNYSSIRAGRLEFQRRVGAFRRQTLEPRVLDPLWRRWVELEVLSGRIDAPDYELAPEDYHDVEWLWPGWGAVDPGKEADADIANIAAGLKSRRQVISARGDDPDSVLEGVAAEPPLPPPAAKPAQQQEQEQ